MNFVKKHYDKFLSIILVLVLLTTFLVAGFYRQENNLSDASIRTIDVEQKTYGEKTELLLEQFNSYQAINTEISVGFEGDMYASIGEILGFDSLAYQDETVVKKFKTNYDYTTNKFYMNISYYSGSTLLESADVEVEPLYDEELDDGYIEFEGNRIYFSESFEVDGLNECIAGVDDVAVIGVGAVVVCGILITLAVTPPSVHQDIITKINYVCETVVQAVKSFWGWFTRWITKVFTRTVAVETTTIVVYQTPTITIDKVKYETKKITKEELDKLPKSEYYIAFADPTNNSFYLSTVNIKIPQATAIMALPTSVKCIGNENYEMLTSVYTATEYGAWNIMDKVGYNVRTPMGSPEYENGLYHYHSQATKYIRTSKYPNGGYYSPHLFFSIPM